MINDYLRCEIEHSNFIKKENILEKLESCYLFEKSNNKQSSDALKDAYEIVDLFFRNNFSFKEYLKDMDTYMSYLQNVNNCSASEKNMISHQYSSFTERTQFLCQILLYLDQLKNQYQGFYKGDLHSFNLRNYKEDTLYFTEFRHLGFSQRNDYDNMYASYIVNKTEVVGLMLYNPTKKCNLPEKLFCFPNPSVKTFDHSSLTDTFFLKILIKHLIL